MNELKMREGVIHIGDSLEVLKQMESNSIHCIVTSPPYWNLRDYRVEGQIGLEKEPRQFICKLVNIFGECRRVLRDDGTLWINIGDTHYQKQLLGIPWRLAFALQRDGWYLRSDCIWNKPNTIPSSVEDRPTKTHEYIFLLAKSRNYFYDYVAIQERAIHAGDEAVVTERYMSANQAKGRGVKPSGNGKVGSKVQVMETRNKRSVWTVTTKGYKGAHYACFPPELIVPCILAGTPQKGCCPQCGAPLKRMVEKIREATRPGTGSKVSKINLPSVIGNRDPERHCTRVNTLGWERTCSCNSGHTVPCKVLDPFIGSGTTAQVAVRYNRHFVGIDLDPKNLPLIKKRLDKILKTGGMRLQ